VKIVPVGIIGVGSAVPEGVVGNEEVATWPGVIAIGKDGPGILKSTGIDCRHIAKPGEMTADFIEIAARNALNDASLSPRDISYILVATSTPSYPLPGDSCILQDRLGATCGASDLRVGCAGFTNALEIANCMVATQLHSNVLVVGADELSTIVDRNDSLAMLLGDGAGAAVISRVEDGLGFRHFVSGSDGSNIQRLWIQSGGTAEPITAEAIEARTNMLRMDGRAVYDFGVEKIETSVRELCAKLGVKLEDVGLIVPHQANRKIIARAAVKLGLPIEKFAIDDIEFHANTSAASIGLALDRQLSNGRLKIGDLVILIGFGAGLAWSGNIGYWAYTRRVA